MAAPGAAQSVQALRPKGHKRETHEHDDDEFFDRRDGRLLG